MQPTQRRLANAIRALAMDAVETANSGHPGMPMGMADAATALFTKVMKYDPANPKWPDRDRFLMGKGHAAVGLFPILADLGYLPTDVLNGYTRLAQEGIDKHHEAYGFLERVLNAGEKAAALSR